MLYAAYKRTMALMSVHAANVLAWRGVTVGVQELIDVGARRFIPKEEGLPAAGTLL